MGTGPDGAGRQPESGWKTYGSSGSYIYQSRWWDFSLIRDQEFVGHVIVCILLWVLINVQLRVFFGYGMGCSLCFLGMGLLWDANWISMACSLWFYGDMFNSGCNENFDDLFFEEDQPGHSSVKILLDSTWSLGKLAYGDSILSPSMHQSWPVMTSGWQSLATALSVHVVHCNRMPEENDLYIGMIWYWSMLDWFILHVCIHTVSEFVTWYYSVLYYDNYDIMSFYHSILCIHIIRSFHVGKLLIHDHHDWMCIADAQKPPRLWSPFNAPAD